MVICGKEREKTNKGGKHKKKGYKSKIFSEELSFFLIYF